MGATPQVPSNASGPLVRPFLENVTSPARAIGSRSRHGVVNGGRRRAQARERVCGIVTSLGDGCHRMTGRRGTEDRRRRASEKIRAREDQEDQDTDNDERPAAGRLQDAGEDQSNAGHPGEERDERVQPELRICEHVLLVPV